ncbi:hypothetical protein EHQ91_13410 [Leptospira biflexa]|uniref:hypothetical protein n=1 Tax=Leptospira biflexa TaxID=172 RepID=UPI0010917941|nr:hypothetical protein [Leptospira biflexa]TGM55883.1 hypothetical protein EHQ91_13410 [Leptospira biflexa]
MKQVIIFITCLFLHTSCLQSGEDIQQKNEEETTWLLSTLLWQRNSGNCIKTDTNTNISMCSRRPLGICNVNQLIVTQAEVNYTLNESRTIQNRNPDCQESILQSGILSQSATSNANSDTIKARYRFLVTESCEASGVQPSSDTRFATFFEIQWLESTRGKIAKAAKSIVANGFLPQNSRDKANSCLQLEFLEWEKGLAEGNLQNKILIEITVP